jgi:phosphoribosylaminoimidazolecarboxamide formyltransferase/IMP cyclohydrolase
MQATEIAEIDLAVVNLYPFEQTVAGGADAATIVENIDIGGPAMIRASAKNHAYVTAVTDPGDYGRVLEALRNDGSVPLALRRELAALAFARTAAYDAAVSSWFATELRWTAPRHRAFGGRLLASCAMAKTRTRLLRSIPMARSAPGWPATQLQGKQLSYNNINDTDAAFELVSEFDRDRAACAIIKHANPCGVAVGDSLVEAYRRALDCDQTSAFGGIMALNRTLDAETATEIVKLFTEVIIAPDASEEAKEILSVKKNLRLMVTGELADPRQPGLTVKTVAGGLLVQGRDNGIVLPEDFKVVTKRAPDARELADLGFAFRVAKHVKSNAIVYALNGATVGIGAGQMSRVDSARIAARKAVDAAEVLGLEAPLTEGSVVASDAFFPFADGLLSAIEAGATAVVQPGGSMRDQDVIDAADEAGIAMVFTGMRHFRH